MSTREAAIEAIYEAEVALGAARHFARRTGSRRALREINEAVSHLIAAAAALASAGDEEEEDET